jgi:prepilin-type N-terminal cleavage/methylation domain-containing protein
MRYTKRANKGFTLLEILLVIAAIGILAAIVLVAINPNRQIEAARQAKRRSDINTITKAIQQYSIDNNGQYPAEIETGAKAICQIGNTPTGCIDLSTFLVPDYLAAIPEADTNSYYIRKNTSGTSIEVTHPRDDIWNIGGTPSLDLNFASNKSLIDSVSGNNLVTFTRASGGTYVGDDGLIKTATTNEPRFDHNPVTGESLGLLVEESRTNLLLRSEEFDAAAWTKSGSTVGVNDVVAPDGALTADKLIEDATTALHFLGQNASFLSGTTYTGSVYLKASERIWTRVGFPASAFAASGRSASFDLSTGTVGQTQTGVTASIVDVGNGWYRCSITATANTTVSNSTNGLAVNVQTADSAVSQSYAGDGVSGIFIWGAQLEVGAFATSYIPTTDSTVTRLVDVASISGSNFSAWYRQDAFTAYVDARLLSKTSARSKHLFMVSDGTATNRIALYNNTLGSFRVFRGADGANSDAEILNQASVLAGVRYRFSGAFASTNAAATVNGAAVTLLTDHPMPSGIDRFGLWRTYSGPDPANAHIARVTFWPTRLSDSTLENITK